ncbi:c-type cytochrome [Thiohalorhabdus sp. Cl-TMA]|uniref:Cytochrome c n=1 Tax=Thiohalorhabdus methylotrophus TaxID=3242694 RepID=A0ABV4TVX9_9GAMM
MWKWLPALLFLAAPAQAALDGDAQNGKKLYKQYCAGQCHTASVHKREDVRATNQAEVVAWIQRQCTQAMAQNLSIQEIEDLATYLNEAYYHYDK